MWMTCYYRFFYLSNNEANMLKDLLAEESGIDDFSSYGFYEFLEQFKVRSLVTKRKIKEKLGEAARTNSKTTYHDCMLETNV